MDLNYTRDTTSGREGLELLERVRTHDRTLPVVVMTGWGSIETAVEAMRRGARSFVQKPWDDTHARRSRASRGRRRAGVAAARREAGARARRGAPDSARALAVGDAGDARLRGRRALDAGVGHRRRLLRRAAVLRRPPRALDRRRRRQGAAGGAAHVEPAGGGSRLRDGGRRAARCLHERQSPALPQHRVGKVRDVLLRGRSTPAADGELRQRRTLPARLTARRRPRRSAGADRARARRGRRLDVHDRVGARSAPGDRLVCFTDGITEANSPPATSSARIG